MRTRAVAVVSRLAALLSVVGALTGALSVARAETSASGAAATARLYTDWFLDGEIDSLLSRLSPELAAKVRGREGLAAFHADVAKSLGDSLTFGEPTAETREGMTVVRQFIHGRVSGVEADIQWGLDSAGVARQFAIRPRAGKEAPSKYLAYESKTKLRLPFRGEWTAFSGGRTLEQNHHARAKNQRFALDLAIMKDGATHTGDGAALESYYCWGAEVRAPASGRVVAAVDTLPDNPIGATDRVNVAGNYVAIDHGNGEFSFLAHFRRGSLKVKKGDRVSAGRVLGLVGNSGNTTEPHIHYHLQDGPAFPDVESMPAAFHDYVADGRLVPRGEPLKGERIRPR